MSLSTGLYTIQNGDNIVADRSLLPKKIVLSPSGSNSTSLKNPAMAVTNISSRVTVLQLRTLRTTILMDVGEITNWIVEPVPQHGENSYIDLLTPLLLGITTPDRTSGWVAPTEIDEQIACRPLIVMPTFPPRYPPNEVFEITEVE
ncbi:serine protease inhibitor [Lentinula lateritia]|nr:serine protease inhibitor [Lentinula lateritia]